MAYSITTPVGLYYNVTGAGSPLCLIGGYRQNSSAWPRPFIARLAHHHTVITFDNRGTGRSEKPAEGYALAIQARDVIGLLDELRYPRAHLLGFSMGGAIAQEVVAAYPRRVDRLILFGTFCGGMWSVTAPWSVVRLLHLTKSLSPEAAARHLRPVTYSREYLATHAHAVEAQMRREIVHPTPAHVARKQMEALRAFDRYHDLSRIRSPTLVATGGDDGLVMPQNSALMARRIPGARLVRVPGLGHRAIWEAPEEMADLVVDFLGRPGPRGAAGQD